MQRLYTYTQQLLRYHNYVAVPGFGGFVASPTAATQCKGWWYPPSKQIGFNSSLNYNDGLLAQAYVKAEHISYEEANLCIANAVTSLQAQLNQQGICHFGVLGTFTSTNGNLQFTPAPHSTLLEEAYGLSPVYFPSATTTSSTSCKHVQFHSSNKAPQHRTHRSMIAAAAAILLLLLLIPINTGNNYHHDMASFVPAAAAIAQQQDQTQPSDSLCLTDNTTVSTYSYHVIIGSFATKTKANQFINELPDDFGYHIVFSEKRYRISHAHFATEEEANAFLASFAPIYPQFSDAWILQVESNL